MLRFCSYYAGSVHSPAPSLGPGLPNPEFGAGVFGRVILESGFQNLLGTGYFGNGTFGILGQTAEFEAHEEGGRVAAVFGAAALDVQVTKHNQLKQDLPTAGWPATRRKVESCHLGPGILQFSGSPVKSSALRILGRVLPVMLRLELFVLLMRSGCGGRPSCLPRCLRDSALCRCIGGAALCFIPAFRSFWPISFGPFYFGVGMFWKSGILGVWDFLAEFGAKHVRGTAPMNSVHRRVGCQGSSDPVK